MASNNPDSSANQSAISEDPKTDVNAAVEELLNTISNKFAGVSSEIFAKMDEMSRRLDNLEAALLANKEKDGGPPKSS
ncbi:heat shock factor-binding protein 1 [Colletotrichum spaethianum]|uniref:Heat shock factor-binding protein 1 n=1 Tax=Colletotrichum spaethianum TaxID=700344 RepID=A0AA37UQQ4_9PEZI|nr:heat shock factor-binding protein 1 [Colletotrichum spaethianum]GKT49232.1 heat shock factor-binding protein 1 [Colletotrichum spaethianum]